MRNIIKNTVILTLITLIASTALAFVYSVTKEPIKESQLLAQQKAYKTIFPEAEKFEAIKTKEYTDEFGSKISDVSRSIADGGTIGYVMTVASKGYGGDIKVAIGIRSDMSITSVLILDASDETPGLGSKIKEEPFYSQFSGISQDSISLDDIDAISGATYSTKGVLNAVNAGLSYARSNLNEEVTSDE